MKKYIIIAGVPRAGKSTVSKAIAAAYGYQHVSMDSILAGIEKVFPETGINTNEEMEEEQRLRKISAKVGPFIRAMTNSGEYDECEYGVIIDVYQLLPEDYVKYVDQEKCEIHYFITGDVTPEERYQMLKKYDTPKDYTYYDSEEDNRESCQEIVTISKLLQQECKKYQLPYMDTSYHRREKIQQFVKGLMET